MRKKVLLINNPSWADVVLFLLLLFYTHTGPKYTHIHVWRDVRESGLLHRMVPKKLGVRFLKWHLSSYPSTLRTWAEGTRHGNWSVQVQLLLPLTVSEFEFLYRSVKAEMEK